MPACLPSSGIAPSQLPRIGEAILSVSAASAGGSEHPTTSASTASNPCLLMRFSLPLPAIRILDPSCPGLTRASIETKRFNEAMDCRVKPGNDDGEAAVH